MSQSQDPKQSLAVLDRLIAVCNPARVERLVDRCGDLASAPVLVVRIIKYQYLEILVAVRLV